MSKNKSKRSFSRLTPRARAVVLISALVSLGAIVSSCTAPPVRAPAARSASDDASFQAFLPQFEEGTSRFINGDPALWLQNASRRDDASIMGGWGAYEMGWDEVGPRYNWAAARFLESGAAIERSQALIVGQDKPAPLALRVTHLFRKEDGVWKLIHRHADPLMDKTAPDAVLQK